MGHYLTLKLPSVSIAFRNNFFRSRNNRFFEFLNSIKISRPPIINSFDHVFGGAGTISNEILAPVNQI